MARPATAARRYAEAAFELALRDDALDAWRDGLGIAVRLIGDERVAGIVGSPAVSLVERKVVIEKLLGERVARPIHNLAFLLATRGRLELLPIVAREFDRLLNQHRGVVEAVVTSATTLTDDETAAIRAKVTAMTGSTVDLRTAIDPTLIGGLTVRIGDRLLDASVRGRLERLRDRLVSGAR